MLFRSSRECTPKYREEPIYADWCDFKIDKWTDARTLKETGTGLSTNWPNAPPQTCQTLGCERPGARKGKYVARLKDSKKGEVHDCEYAESKWSSLAPGSMWSLKYNSATGNLRCKTITAPEK